MPAPPPPGLPAPPPRAAPPPQGQPAPPPRAVLGLDGCPGGWAGALVTAGGVSWRRYDGHGEGLLAALAEPVDCIGIDIPIGLPGPGGRRAADEETRAALGPRRSSVFPAPWRGLLGRPDHATTSAESVRRAGRGVSIQAYGIFARIGAVDAVLTPEIQRRLVEVHPELAFRAMTGCIDPAGAVSAGAGPAVEVGSKHTPVGLARRLEALRAVLPPFDLDDRPARVRRDDALDALACAWTARRWLAGTALLLPAEPPRDERGLLMGVAG